MTTAARYPHHHRNSGAMERAWNLSLNLTDTPLPAVCPPEDRGLERDEVKLLVLDKDTGRTEHATFRDLPMFLRAGDVLVVNTSRTIAASLPAIRLATKCALRIHLASKLTDRVYIVERRGENGGPDDDPLVVGEKVRVGEGMLTVIGRFHPNSRLWYVESTLDLWQEAEKIGKPIRYLYLSCDPELEAFQTIFAKDPGSAEMPSAARPFSQRVVDALRDRGVQIGEITLHTGVSSHEVSGSLADHPFLPEWYKVSRETADLVNGAKHRGGRIIAAGTTVVRALESATNGVGRVEARSGWTTLVITPEHPARTVTGIITGLHERDTSHLAMLYSFVDQAQLTSAYNEAIANGYLWHEFGDSNLIL
ncbi:S-adenosylmethionine:tRNA ribosyltransferase-isomerase [Alicyclobacillus dauci]|uniref:S-adenosylmethionine:tRNA ribosyltransferase-isomerase n=1 Tax=Alicyclobacillus dauci TaxID=1475485 RepID=A0ABY6Z067_9BACL|nr:S-adenosylmethionine:tRNA ribosyltransferase-isomerase [Alicyclobacillus dauci]WAH36226.1 S-adenosylmethionine:tRNA ribosyltransferase-isomerase [Alicyclobacillus dauci]